MTKLTAALFVPVMLAGANPFSVGKNLIDQTFVRADGGFPYKITRSGSYKLTGNLTVPAGKDGIDILASDVTLDLNGFSIDGPVACTSNPTACPVQDGGVGIKSGETGEPGPSRVTVKNGSVHGMESFGILLTGDGSIVEGVTAKSNAGSGIIITGSVSASWAIDNGQSGIVASMVRNSRSIGNIGDGIALNGRGSVAIGNMSTQNGGRGIVAVASSVSENTVTLNHSFAIDASCPSDITGNTIAANGASIEVSDESCVLVNNVIRP